MVAFFVCTQMFGVYTIVNLLQVKDDSIKGRRVDDTRVDPEDLVNDLLSRTDFGFTEQNECKY